MTARVVGISSLSGGPADKAGGIYEALWGIEALMRVYAKEAQSIRIEITGVDKAEFGLEVAGTVEYWQAKRQILKQSGWTLLALRREGILGFFLERCRMGHKCVFASTSDAAELRTMAEEARKLDSFSSFKQAFLNKTHQKHFDVLRKHWSDLSDEAAYNFLKLVTVKTADRHTLEDGLLRWLGILFQGCPRTPLEHLKSLYEGSSGKRLSADDIRRFLEGRDVRLRTPSFDADALRGLGSVTDTYLGGQRASLIRRQQIPRTLASEIISKITESRDGQDILITGAAGTGKSACLLQIVEGLRASGVPVLAFRLDNLPPVRTPIALGTELGLPESPAVVLARSHPGRKVVLALDQLDVVSSSSGRHPSFFDTVAALVSEVRGLRHESEVHLILSCRKFDFDNDSRLRSLLPKETGPLELGLLTPDEVKAVIEADGGQIARLSPKQLDLLRLPQSLSLFIEAGLATVAQPSFMSQKALFDAYWDAKRREVCARRAGEPDQWKPILGRLTSEMSLRQELSVPKAVLDQFSPEFVSAMVSVGVLVFDAKRYGLSHESYFDYCFARSVAASGQEFSVTLEADDQQLFRRAQLRAVLVYLRDDDPARYLRNVRALLGSAHVRPHLKLLLIDLLANFPDPSDEEWSIIQPLVETALTDLTPATTNPDKLARATLEAFAKSPALFAIADRHGCVVHWLTCGNPVVEDCLTRILAVQTTHHADRIAELLMPFLGSGGEWPARLRYVLQMGMSGNSRPFRDLFLKSLEVETMDELGSDEMFWTHLHGFGERDPEGCAAVAARWLDRQVRLAVASRHPDAAPQVNLQDHAGVQELYTSARKEPGIFLVQVLPAILRAAEATKQSADSGLAYDSIWTSHYLSDHVSLDDAYLGACEEAFRLVATQAPQSLRPSVDVLRSSRTRTANYLLLHAYLSAPVHFADEAIALLAAEPERLHCGYSDSGHWKSKCLIEQCSPHCSEASLLSLEPTLLTYATTGERSSEGTDWIGHARFGLLCAIPATRRSKTVEHEIDALTAKFKTPASAPVGARSYTVVSPVPGETASQFNDDQWLAAIAQCRTSREQPDWEHPERGGMEDFAGLLRGFVEREPERFARLALRFPQGTPPCYLMNVLYGLKEAAIAAALKIEVARRVFLSDDTACLKAALDLLGNIKDGVLPQDAIDFIIRLALEHPDPPPSPPPTHGDGAPTLPEEDPLSIGINSVRGVAALTIRDLIFSDSQYLSLLLPAVQELVNDPALAVRACAASTLLAVAHWDPHLALPLFTQLCGADDSLLATRDVGTFVWHGLPKHYHELRSHIERMLGSKLKEVHQKGARLACLARLYHPDADDLAERALGGDEAVRLGAAEVAAANVGHSQCRAWCETALGRLFEDSDKTVRHCAADCFRQLGQRAAPLLDFEPLIRTFLKSRTFAEEPIHLLHALTESTQRIPPVVLDVCEQFIDQCAAQAADIRTRHALGQSSVSTLVFRAYAQHADASLRNRALDLIDRFCLEGLGGASAALATFDR